MKFKPGDYFCNPLSTGRTYGRVLSYRHDMYICVLSNGEIIHYFLDVAKLISEEEFKRVMLEEL